MMDSQFEDHLPTLIASPNGGDTAAAPSDEEWSTIPRPFVEERSSAPGEAPPPIAGYEVYDRLGQGGMGVVYRARHLGLKRLVALKVMRHCGSAIDNQRFRREAELAARLQHPHIVQVYEVGAYRESANGPEQPYIAFELVCGGGLNRLLDDAVLSPRQAAALLETLARTMQVVHDRGIVHRDLKPANVLLSVGQGLKPVSSGVRLESLTYVPKITDFGLACLPQEDLGLSRTGQLLGTPGYMAPEQVIGRPRGSKTGRGVGPATDIHALGAILYECLTGRPPFKGASLHETLALICEQEPVGVRRLRPDVPRDLETICLKCLHKEPHRRYASAGELADDLRRFQQGRPILARPVSHLTRVWRWCRRQPLLAVLIAACAMLAATLLAGAGWYASRMAETRSAIASAAVEVEEAQEVAATQGYFALLHANREQASRREPGWPSAGLANLQRAAGLPTRAIDRLELRSEAARCLGEIDLRPARTISAGFTARRIAFHPNQPLLAIGQAKGFLCCAVVLVDLQTGKISRRLSLPSGRCWDGNRLVQDGVTALAFSPDGRWLLAGARTGVLHRWDLTLPSSQPICWKAHGKTVEDLLFAPGGDVLFSAAENVKRWSIRDNWKETHHLAVSGRLAPGATPGSLLVSDHHQVHLAAQADLKPLRSPMPVRGRRVRFRGRGPAVLADKASLFLLDAAGGRITQTLRGRGSEDAHEGEINEIDLSPDGLTLASLSEQTRHVRVWETVGGRMLADLPMVEGVVQAVFAPNGRTLAVLTGRKVLFHDLRGFEVQSFAALHAWPVLMYTWVGKEGGLACLAGDRANRQGELDLWANTDQKAPDWCVPLPLPMTRMPVRLGADAAGKWLACTEGDGLGVFPVDRWQERLATAAKVESLAFAPEGRLWVAGGLRVQARTLPGLRAGPGWDNILGDLVTGLGTQWAVAAGRDRVVSGGRDGCLRLLDARTGELRMERRMCTSPVCSVALSADEQLALVGTWKGGVHLVRLPAGEKIELPGRHRDRVEAVAFLGAGLLASGSADRTVRLYRFDGRTVSEWLTLRMNKSVQALSGAPTGERLAVLLAGERAVRIWDLKRLRERLEGMGLE